MAFFQAGNSRPAYGRAAGNRIDTIARRTSLRVRRPRWLRSRQTSRRPRLGSAAEAGPWPYSQSHPRARRAAGAGRPWHAFVPPPIGGGALLWPRAALAALPPARRTDSPHTNGHGPWSWARRRGNSTTSVCAVAPAAATATAADATVGATCGCGGREGDGGTTVTSGDSGGERSGGIAATGCTPLAQTGDEATRPVSALAAATALLAPTAAAAPVATRAAALAGTLTGTMVAEWAASWPCPRLAVRGSSAHHESPHNAASSPASAMAA